MSKCIVSSKEELYDMKILLVDDESKLLEVTKSNLLENFSNVYTAHNGKEALKILDTELDIDVIIVDLMMPNMNGFELLKELQCKNAGVLPFVVSSCEDKLSLKEAFRSGAIDYLEKPVSSSDLLNMIRKAQNLKVNHDREKKLLKKENFILQRSLRKEINARSSKEYALREIINEIEKGKSQINENITINIEKNIKPLLRQVKNQVSLLKVPERNDLVRKIGVLSYEIDNLSSDFYKKLISYNFMLSQAELRVCKLLYSGLIIKEVASNLNISVNTAKNHIKNIKRKMGISGTRQKLRHHLNDIIGS